MGVGGLGDSREQVQTILRALKYGVVPEDVFSFGIEREVELEEFKHMFNHAKHGGGMTKFIVGKYGSGKSFLLQSIQERAWQQNFVVAKVQMEKGLRLNNFQTLYYHIMHRLTTMESEHKGTSFQDLFDRWIETLRLIDDKESSAQDIQEVVSVLNQYNLSFSRALLFYVRARIQGDHETAHAVTSWLTGEQNIPFALKKKFDIVGNIDHTNAVDFLKAFVKLIRMLGYSGLVVLVDELELVLNERSDIRLQAYQNLRYLIDNCYNEQLNHCIFTFAATPDWLGHEEKGPQTYPALYQRIGQKSNSKFTKNTDMRQPIIHLEQFSTEERHRLTRNIVELYSYGYEFNLKISLKSLHNWVIMLLQEEGLEIKDIQIRLYITKLMEVLDIMEQNPKSRVFNAELKIVTDGKTSRFVQTMRTK